MRLNFTPLPQNNESPISLLFRFAKHNGYQSIVQLSKDYPELKLRPNKFNVLHWKGSSLFLFLSQNPTLTEPERKCVEQCFYKYHRSSSVDLIDIGGIQFPASCIRKHLVLCPDCVRSGYLPQMHDLSFCNVCAIHGERLLDRCPSCENIFDWFTLKDFHCPCGFDIRMATATFLDSRDSEIISKALEERNSAFFALFNDCLKAYIFSRLSIDENDILHSCIRIATGNKSYFFREILRLQKKFPTLHRRAILAPFLLSQNHTLHTYAKECYLKTRQTKPKNHPTDCQCNALRFTLKQISFILSKQRETFEINDKHLQKHKNNTQETGYTYSCPKLCSALYNLPHIKWEDDEIQLDAMLDCEIVNCKEAAKILHTTAPTIARLINEGFLYGGELPKPTGLATTWEAIQNFNSRYILRSEIFHSSEIPRKKLCSELNKINPIKIQTTRYSRKLTLYRRKDIPDSIFRRPHAKQPITTRRQTINKNKKVYTKLESAARLGMAYGDIPYLEKLGIIESCLRPDKKLPTYSEKSLTNAMKWKENYISLSEAAKQTGIPINTILKHFINTNYITCVDLLRTYITKEDALKISNHYQNYISLKQLMLKTHLSTITIRELISSNKISPLTSEHPDYLDNMITFKITECENALKQHYKESRRPFSTFKLR